MNTDKEPVLAQHLIARLQEAVPEFEPDPDDVRDGLNYLVFNSLMGYIENLNPETDRERLQRIFNFIDFAAQSSDRSVVDVIRDALWGLASYSDIGLYKSFIGKHGKTLLKQVPLLRTYP